MSDFIISQRLSFVNIYFVIQSIKFCKLPLTYGLLCVTMYKNKQFERTESDLLNTESFKRGTVDLVVLSVLMEKDMYGYEIVKTVKEKSDGNYEIPLGTLYPVLYRYLESGYLSDRDEIVGKRLRKYYHLEDKGREFYKELLQEYRKISAGVNLITEAVNDIEE